MAQASGNPADPAARPAGSDSSMLAGAVSAYERVSNLAAWRGPAHWRALVSPYTHHWRPSDEHEDVYAVGLERQYDDRWLLGGSLFSNSFGQPSGYVYIGRRHYDLLQQPALYFQWSVGVMYGYTGEYQDKVPLNFGGFSPGALISLGWQASRQWSFTLHALGDAGVMLQVAYDFH